MNKAISFLVLLLIVSSTVTAQKKGKEPQPTDWTTYDFTKHYTIKNGGGKKEFADNKRIFIGNFQITQKVVTNGTQMGASNFAKMTVGLTPIDINQYQELVDKLYAQFIEQLKSQGYEIVSDEEVANSAFAKQEHNGKSIFCQYVNDVAYDKDQFKNEVVYIWPKNKFIVVNTKAIAGTWPTKSAKALNANVLNVNLIVDAVSFDGSRRTGYKGAASIEGFPNLAVFPFCSASNSRGGFAVWGNSLYANNNKWVGANGMYETGNDTNVFGSVKGAYVIDVNQDAFLAEVGTVASGLSKGFTQALMNQLK